MRCILLIAALLLGVALSAEIQTFTLEVSSTLSSGDVSKITSSAVAARDTFNVDVSQSLATEFPTAKTSLMIQYPQAGGSELRIAYVISAISSSDILNLHEKLLSWSTSNFPLATALASAASNAFSGVVLSPTMQKSIPCRSSGGASTPAPGCSAVTPFTMTLGSNADLASFERLLCDSMALDNCGSQLSVSLVGLSASCSVQNIPNGFEKVLLVVNKIRLGDSSFNTLNVQTMTVGSSTVYTKDEATLASLLTSTADTDQSCTQRDYWWLVFLILILPISFIIIRHGYRRGKKKGFQQQKDKIKDKEHQEEVIHQRNIQQQEHQPRHQHYQSQQDNQRHQQNQQRPQQGY